MKSKDLISAMGRIDPEYIADAAPDNAHKCVNNESSTAAVPRRRSRLRLAAVLAAATVCVFIMAVGVAARVNGSGIADLFESRWSGLFDEPMDEEHYDSIGVLSQSIGISKTVNDVTVTVDSAAVGEDMFYLLLRVKGLEKSDRKSYNFHEEDLSIGSIFDRGPETTGLAWGVGRFDDEGDFLIFVSCEFDYKSDSGEVSGKPLDIRLKLKDIEEQEEGSDHRKKVVDGKWTFRFKLDRNVPIEKIELGDTEEFDDIEITNFGISFTDKMNTIPGGYNCNVVYAVLNDGKTIRCGGGYGTAYGTAPDTAFDKNESASYTFTFDIPVNIDDVAYIVIGSVEIPITPAE